MTSLFAEQIKKLKLLNIICVHIIISELVTETLAKCNLYKYKQCTSI